MYSRGPQGGGDCSANQDKKIWGKCPEPEEKGSWEFEAPSPAQGPQKFLVPSFADIRSENGSLGAMDEHMWGAGPVQGMSTLEWLAPFFGSPRGGMDRSQWERIPSPPPLSSPSTPGPASQGPDPAHVFMLEGSQLLALEDAHSGQVALRSPPPTMSLPESRPQQYLEEFPESPRPLLEGANRPMVMGSGLPAEVPPGQRVKRAVHTRVTEVQLPNFGHKVLKEQAIFEFEDVPSQPTVPR